MRHVPRRIPHSGFLTFAGALALLAAGAPAGADESPRAAAPALAAAPLEIRSMGQPPLWKPYLAGSFVSNGEADRTGGVGVLGVHKDLMNPMIGAIGLSAEGYAGASGGRWDAGARVLAASRLFFVNLGLDWNARDEKVDFIMAFTPYFRRGGLFGTGGNFRLEWIPGRGNSWNVGFQVPLQPHMGKTRTVATRAPLPKAPRRPKATQLPPAAAAALEDLRHEAAWLIGYTTPYATIREKSHEAILEHFRATLAKAREAFRATDARHPQGHSFATEMRLYEASFDRAFAAAVGEAAGREVSDCARDALLEEVLLPYDRLIGRRKDRDDIGGLAARARSRLAAALESAAGLDQPRREAALLVFDRIVDTIDEGRRRKQADWEGDDRKVWLPLDLALRHGSHDTQAGLDAVIERAVGRPFTRGNAVFPTNSGRFLLELLRSIRAARDYHVLWIHDFAGITRGQPDPVSHRVTVEGYLRTLTERVREFDTTGRLPSFLIFHTQWFYEPNQGRLFLSVLEDPLHHELKLGAGYAEMERSVRAAQDELRRAVAGSAGLQRLARERGKGFVEGLVKVHVSVTLPADLSFRSAGLVRHVPFVPDTLMLDHRKLFFYDVSEDDPGRGAALFTGTGVGSTYMTSTWEDRGLLVSGPSLLDLKLAAHRLLRSQGFSEEQVPAPLRPRAKPADYEARVAALEASGRHARGMNVHNQPGYAPKETTLLQSLVYTLAPPGTLIVVPDSLWTNPLWSWQLAAAALRGCHVYVVAPSYDNSPADAAPVMARTREIMAGLVETRTQLAAEIAAAGGQLRVGLYTRRAPAGDTLAKIREAADGLRSQPFLLDEFPLPRGLVQLLDTQADALQAAGYAPTLLANLGREGRPRMHRKTQFFASRAALRALADDPRTLENLKRQLDTRAEVTANPDAVLEQADPLATPDPVAEIARSEPPEPARGAVYYLTVGSKNQDPRSAFLDGETEYVVAGPSALRAYSDFMFLLAATTWLEDQATLDRLIPVTDERSRRLGRFIQRLI